MPGPVTIENALKQKGKQKTHQLTFFFQTYQATSPVGTNDPVRPTDLYQPHSGPVQRVGFRPGSPQPWSPDLQGWPNRLRCPSCYVRFLFVRLKGKMWQADSFKAQFLPRFNQSSVHSSLQSSHQDLYEVGDKTCIVDMLSIRGLTCMAKGSSSVHFHLHPKALNVGGAHSFTLKRVLSN